MTVNQSQIIFTKLGILLLVAVNIYTVAVFAVQFDISPALIIVLCPDSAHKKPDSFLCHLNPGKEDRGKRKSLSVLHSLRLRLSRVGIFTCRIENTNRIEN